MKKITNYFAAILLAFFISAGTSYAQDDSEGFDFTQPELEQTSNLAIPLLYSQVGEQGYVGIRIQPELVFGKLGFGLDIPVMFNVDDWKLRTDEFESGVGWLRMLRYIRWGVKKRDPVYVRVGELSGAYLGYGILVNNYENSVSFDKRKIGAEFDILINDMYGLEGMYSDFDFTSLNLLATRAYIRPLGKSGIPIIKTLDVGVSYVTDHDNTKIITDSISIGNKYIESGQNAIAGDIGVQLINNSFVHLTAFTQYAYLMENTSDSLKQDLNLIASLGLTPEQRTLIANYGSGSGISAGLDFKVKILDKVLRLDARLERVWYNDYFIPQFFDVGYEMGKDNKVLSLANSKGQQGTIGSLAVMVLSKVSVGGSLWIPDEMGEQAPALLQLNFDASKLSEKIVLKGYYVKTGLAEMSEALKIDDRSLAKLRIAYKFYKVLEIGLDYKWTFAVDENQEWTATNYITPYFGLSIPLNF